MLWQNPHYGACVSYRKEKKRVKKAKREAKKARAQGGDATGAAATSATTVAAAVGGGGGLRTNAEAREAGVTRSHPSGYARYLARCDYHQL